MITCTHGLNSLKYAIKLPSMVQGPRSVPCPVTQWWNPALLDSLPFSMRIKNKPCIELTKAGSLTAAGEDYYHPFELTVLQDLFAFSEINHSVRDYMPNFTTDFSPFRSHFIQ